MMWGMCRRREAAVQVAAPYCNTNALHYPSALCVLQFLAPHLIPGNLADQWKSECLCAVNPSTCGNEALTGASLGFWWLSDDVICWFGYLWHPLHQFRDICNFHQDISRPFEQQFKNPALTLWWRVFRPINSLYGVLRQLFNPSGYGFRPFYTAYIRPVKCGYSCYVVGPKNVSTADNNGFRLSVMLDCGDKKWLQVT